MSITDNTMEYGQDSNGELLVGSQERTVYDREGDRHAIELSRKLFGDRQ